MHKRNSFIRSLVVCIGLLWLFSGLLQPANAQKPRLIKDYSFVMEIPAVEALESSLTHIYVLSSVEGISVFRSRPDTLQWLYTTPGMSQRGKNLDADIRFAYLYGAQKRFSVLEPTSVVGVYSATNLPAAPTGVHRLATNLYIGLGAEGLGRLSLTSPSAFDSVVTYPAQQQIRGKEILNLAGDASTLIVSTSAPSILQFELEDGELALQSRITPEEPLSYIHYQDDQLYGSTREGNIYRINAKGTQRRIGSIGEKALKIRPWKDWLIIRGTSNRLWTSFRDGKPELWKDNGQAGNYFTINKEQFWINEYNKIARIKQIDPLAASRKDTLGLFVNITDIEFRPIQNYTTPLPHPVLIPIELTEEYPVEAIQYTYESSTIEDAYLRKQGFYWQPGSDDVGRHRVKLIATSSSGATDSVQFTIEVKSFNTPPRFTPIRSVTIPTGESFSMPINAFDPDGTYPQLIRYLGRNLPNGSQINPQTGKFTWSPNTDQTGSYTFEVIATDQFGAASSKEVNLRVISKPKYDQ